MAGGRPRKDQTENRAELCKLTRDFVAALRLHSPQFGNNMAELERQLGMSTHGDGDYDGGNTSHGKTLAHWQKAGQKGGQCPTAERLQYWVVEARKKGLLPPLKGPGGIRRFDEYYVGVNLVEREDLAEIVKERLAQAKELERARAQAVAALAAYASAVKGAGEWRVVAEVIDHGGKYTTEDGEMNNIESVEASPEELLNLARKIEGHYWHFMPSL